ncbi:hypothetical protein LTR66_009262 [Elasticomyces elasticus]|nr:hypothetical protein LTR66_009262 [Elasticomyces elasticus]
MLSLISLLVVAATVRLAAAHTVISYPGYRGNNLVSNGTVPALNPNSIGIDYSPNGTVSFPYGMQWMYPCGGMPLSRNRTKWPVGGGAIAVQPGWFPGHSAAFFYFNMGIGNESHINPPNMSHALLPPLQITGPTNVEYKGTFCLPQVPMPANLTFKVGDNVTIQVIETAQHGAALYNCVDVTLADPADVEPVTPANCFNSSDLGFNLVFTTRSLSAAPSVFEGLSSSVIILPLLASVLALGLWT